MDVIDSTMAYTLEVSFANWKSPVRTGRGIHLRGFPHLSPKLRYMVVRVAWHMWHLNVPFVLDMTRHRDILAGWSQSWHITSILHGGTAAMPLKVADTRPSAVKLGPWSAAEAVTLRLRLRRSVPPYSEGYEDNNLQRQS